MSNDGTKLERYIESIERCFQPTGAAIKRNDIIQTKYGPREFNVTVKIPSENGEYALIAFEAKDWGAKPPVSVVEAFIQKCRVANVTQGIMISRVGFSEPSIKQAIDFNLTLLQVADTEDIDWKREVKLPFYIEQEKLESILVLIKRSDDIEFDLSENTISDEFQEQIKANVDAVLESTKDLNELKKIYSADLDFSITNGVDTIGISAQFRLIFRRNVYFKSKPAIYVQGYENLNNSQLKSKKLGAKSG